MSLDLDWSLLDDQLASRFLEGINRALEASASKRPSFLGDIQFTNLQFGTHAPDVTIRSITDIWSDFVSLDDVPPPPLGTTATGMADRGVSRNRYRDVTPAASNDTTLVDSPPLPLSSHDHHHHLGGREDAFVASPPELPLRTYTQFDDGAPPHRIQGPPSVVSASIAGGLSTPASATPHHPYYQQWSAALASRGIRAAGVGVGVGTPSLSSHHQHQHQQGAGSLNPAIVTNASAPISPMDSVPPSPGYFTYWNQQNHPHPHPHQQQQQQQHFQPLMSATGLQPPLPFPYSANTSRHTSFDASSLPAGSGGGGVGGGGGIGGPGPQSSVSQVGARRDRQDRLLPYQAPGARPSFRSTPAASFRSMSGQISPPHLHSSGVPGGGGGIDDTSSSMSALPSLQMHLSLHWPSTTFRLTISTSLLINYPSPAFMSLPLTLSVTGFVMRAGLIVALEGERRRTHICLVEDEANDDYPAANGVADRDADEHGHAHAHGYAPGPGTAGKKLGPGLSILPNLTFESEVGQTDKHVLKNVGKVEKFVAEVLRKGLEDELVFPNYYTIDLPAVKASSTSSR
ncbi:hypothetical protein BCV70DRAFT_199981 [Testicularia cyperi]|uniref:Mitochondrial distribution and morphology protein 12 n=1 Tax=Testicularia cyperi TaxID=1882483 RepID=A0A317XQZ3_9BASI|nr:hypothetical protein BCV70DRAFT_199981 [Testicularia cyperi]